MESKNIFICALLIALTLNIIQCEEYVYNIKDILTQRRCLSYPDYYKKHYYEIDILLNGNFKGKIENFPVALLTSENEDRKILKCPEISDTNIIHCFIWPQVQGTYYLNSEKYTYENSIIVSHSSNIPIGITKERTILNDNERLFPEEYSFNYENTDPNKTYILESNDIQIGDSTTKYEMYIVENGKKITCKSKKIIRDRKNLECKFSFSDLPPKEYYLPTTYTLKLIDPCGFEVKGQTMKMSVTLSSETEVENKHIIQDRQSGYFFLKNEIMFKTEVNYTDGGMMDLGRPHIETQPIFKNLEISTYDILDFFGPTGIPGGMCYIKKNVNYYFDYFKKEYETNDKKLKEFEKLYLSKLKKDKFTVVFPINDGRTDYQVKMKKNVLSEEKNLKCAKEAKKLLGEIRCEIDIKMFQAFEKLEKFEFEITQRDKTLMIFAFYVKGVKGEDVPVGVVSEMSNFETAKRKVGAWIYGFIILGLTILIALIIALIQCIFRKKNPGKKKKSNDRELEFL